MKIIEPIRLGVQEKLTQRIQAHDRRLGNTIYLDDSSTWYVTENQTQGYLSVHDNKKYAEQMIATEVSLLEEALKQMDRPEEIQIIDLGPGAADKAKILLDAFADIDVRYAAIDISRTMLEHTKNALTQYDVPQQYFLGDFAQDLPQLRKNIGLAPALVYFGATYSNYPPAFLKTLANTMQPQDSIYVSAQLKPADIHGLVTAYTHTAYMDCLTEGIKQLGLNIDDRSVEFNEQTSSVEQSFIVTNIPRPLEGSGLRLGDKIIMFTSRKPTKKEFEEHVNDCFNGSVYTNDEFIAFLGKCK